jgi:hypothetical protein
MAGSLFIGSATFSEASSGAGLHRQHKNLREYTATAPEPANPGCGVTHDFNTTAHSLAHYQYIAVCPLH